MIRLQDAARALLLLGASLGLVGCPVVLEDDFRTVPGDVMGSGGQPNNAGGKSPGGGNGAAAAGDSGVTSGTNTGGSAGSAGSSSDGGQSGSGPLGSEAGASGEGGAPAVDPCASCTDHEECCDDECVDVRFDNNNCRECGIGCPGTSCDAGTCTNTCAFGFIDCNKNVVDGCEVTPAEDVQNCGNCGIVCGSGLECVEGYCVCPAGRADCDGQPENGCEADTNSDEASCGGCGKTCAANQICNSGSCGCDVGFDDCNQLPDDGCEADLTNNATCGSCGLDCGLHGTCVAAGQCGCVPGYLDCDQGALGCETPSTDPLHCGSCQVSCMNPTPACDGLTCTDGCNGLTACGGSCVDTDIDPENCGGCGKAVGLNQVCVDGKPECVTGYGDCDANPKDCEANTDSDVDHCGVCDNECKSGALCNAGDCACAPTTPNDCGATCAQCCNDGQCSDGDLCTAESCSNGVCSSGTECASGGTCCSGTGCFECCQDSDCAVGKICSGNACVTLTCTLPQVLCNSKCVDPTTDAKNCNGCGNDCRLGRSCGSSACTPKWVTIAAKPASFATREKAAYAAMGSKVFVWGGNDSNGTNLANGAVYDPDTDTWATVGTAGSPPSARVLATAVWTGSKMVVWGGGDAAGNTDYATGGRYDPATDSWLPMSTVGAPSGRRAAFGYWTGSRVAFYSGFDRGGNPFSALYSYDPVADAWSTTNTTDRPTGQLDPTLGFTGSLLLKYGGHVGATSEDNTDIYDFGLDSWQNVANGPSQRYGAMGGWDGAYLVVWSGANGNTLKTDGKLYDPTTDKWTSMLTNGAPSPRIFQHRASGWSARIKPRQTLMVGGNGSAGYLTNGGIFNSTTNAWTAVAAWPSGATHLWGVGVWTGTEMVIWGGRVTTNSALSSAGQRYLP